MTSTARRAPRASVPPRASSDSPVAIAITVFLPFAVVAIFIHVRSHPPATHPVKSATAPPVAPAPAPPPAETAVAGAAEAPASDSAQGDAPLAGDIPDDGADDASAAPPPPAAPPVTAADRVVAEAQRYMGVPYKFGAALSEAPKVFDCSLFMKFLFAKEGVKLPRTARDQAKHGVEVGKEDLRKGDVVFFKTTKRPYPIDHVGMYIGDNRFINTYGKPGVCIRQLFGTFWGNHVVTFRRMLKD